MWQGFGFNNPFAQVKRRHRGKGRKRHFWQKFGGQENNNNGWGNQGNNNGWGNENNNNGWGNENNNNGWGENNGWGNEGNNNNGWGNEENNNGWGFNSYNHNSSLWGNNLNGYAWIAQQQKRNQGQIINFNMGDIHNIIEQQIVLLEPSPAKKKLQELKKTGQTFKDDRFPPVQTSLTGQWGHVSQWKQIKWTRISEGLPGAKIFQGKIEPGDICQGYLGDCYFLAALAALAQRPDRIFNLFLMTQVNQQKYYSVKMLYKGKWMTIDMDEYVPFLYNKPAFTRAQKNQLWVVLLEKAWAKLYSSYKRIQAGYPEQGLHDLTGAPIKQIYMHHSSFDKQREWNYLLKASQLEYSMVSSSQPGSDTTKSFSGVVQGHAYTFLNATYLNFKGQRHRIVQMRNPWGKGQFKGKWSDYDNNWDYVDQSEKDRVGFNPNHDDGIFFMSYDDYCQQFRAMTVAEVDDNASYVYKSYKDPKNRGCYFKVKILKAGNYSLQVDKTPERSYTQQIQNSFQYPLAQLQMAKLNGGSIQRMQGTNSRRRTLFHDIDLQEGEYIVKVKIHYDKTLQKEYDVNLAVYAQYPCQVHLATTNQADKFQGRSTDWSGQQIQNKRQWNDLRAYGNDNNNNGWQSQGENNGWGQQNNNNGWGQQSNNNGWGQSNNNNNGWGQSNNNNNGWGQSNNNNNGNNGWGDGW